MATGAGRSLDEALTALKREGCALLVVGDVPTDVYACACHRLFGDDASASRRRLLVFTDATATEARRRLAGAGSARPGTPATVVTRAGRARSSAAAEEGSGPAVHAVTVEDRSLEALGTAVSEAVSDCRRAAGGLDPAELRVGVDSLDSVVEEHGPAAAFRFAHALASRVAGRGGMSHFHLQRPRSDRAVRTFTPLFDVVVELQIRDGRPEQRWHLRDEDVSVGWFAL